jgi:DNA-binding NtrC family response regulator
MLFKHGPPPRPVPVLVLEDDVDFRRLLLDLLADEGLDASACTTYAALLNAVYGFRRTVVLADFWGASHAELSPHERDEIRELGRHAPTILLTGRAWAVAMTPEELNVACILSKPPALDEVVAQVLRCMRVAASQ